MNGLFSFNTLCFLLIGALLIGFTVFDGLNLGSGIMHLILGKTDQERKVHLSAIGPFWFGYEVWLLAAGGTIVSAFPTLYAKGFSGFYLVLSIVLWLLMIRGTSIEYRHQVESPIWKSFWDGAYAVSCLLLALVFGAAIGNIARGVPLDSHQEFTGTLGQALNPYALGVGIFNVLFLMMHGSLFIAVKSPLQEHKERAAKWAYGLFFAMIVFSAVVIGSTFAVRPNILANYHTLPILAIMPIAATFGAIGIPLSLRKNSYGGALYSSSIMIAFMILTLFCGLYPTLLPALGNDALNMTIFNTAVSSWNLALVAGLNIFGMIIVVFYAIYIHKVFKGTVDLNDIDHSY